MKNKRKTPTKPRNCESKDRGISISQVTECRHMWMDGICAKCGCRKEDVGQADVKSK